MPRKYKGKQKSGTVSNSRSGPGSGSQTARASTSNSGLSFQWDEGRISKWTQEAIETRLAEREARFEARRQGIEELKNNGNKRYQAGDYEGAVTTYSYVLKLYGAHPTIFSNIAAALLKLENYSYAELMATEALKREPANLKARFRRAMARKGLERYLSALADLSTVVSADPKLNDARQEQRLIADLIRQSNAQNHTDFYRDPISPDSEELFDDMDPDFPSIDEPPLIYEEDDVDSDSEDAEHKGNGIACKYYNRGTCIEGESCEYSHAPDDKSQRDKLGRNVCNYYLLGNCIFGKKKCYYLHDKRHLGDGWWNNEMAVAQGQALFGPGLEPHHMGSSLNAFMAGLIRRAQRDAGIDPSTSGPGTRFGYRQGRDGKKKASTKPTPLDERFLMVLALAQGLDYDYQQPTINALKSKHPVKVVQSAADAATLLASPHLVGIFATDAGIADPKHAKLLLKIIEYLKAGGRLVLGGGFSSFVRPSDANLLFRKFGFHWTNSNYYRTTFSANATSLLAGENPSLESPYSMKAVDLAGVNSQHAVYLPAEQVGGRPNPPAVYAPVEKGFLGYIGDVNWEDGSITLLQAMLGLLDTFVKPEKGITSPLPSPKSNASPSSSSLPNALPCSSNKLPSPKFVLLLSFDPPKDFSEKYECFLSALGQRINYDQALDGRTAFEKMASPQLEAIFIMDGGIVGPLYQGVLAKLIEYVQDGGNLVLGADFGHTLNEEKFNKFFGVSCNLPWLRGTFDRTTAVLNSGHAIARSQPMLPPAFTMKSVNLSEVRAKDVLFVAWDDLEKIADGNDDSDNDSDDSDSSYEGAYGDIEAPIVRAQVGGGHVAYVGDVKTEEGTLQVLLELLCPAEKSASTPDIGSTSAQLLTPGNAVKPQSKPFALVLTFGHAKEFTRNHADILDAIGEKLEVVHGLSVQRALELMNSLDLKAIFIPYADIIKPEHGYLVSKLVEFTKSGGNVIFGGYFASSIEVDQVGPFFEKWELKWTAQPDSRITSEAIANMKNGLARNHCATTELLPRSWRLTALHLSGISGVMAVYVPEQDVLVSRAPIVFARVEDGNVGYIGEIGISDVHVKTVLAMLRMLRTSGNR